MQQKYLCFLAIFYLVLFSMKTAAAAGEAEFYLEPMIVAAARYDNSAGKPGYYKVDEKKLENGNYDNALDVIQQLPGVTLMARGASGGMNAYSKILLNGSDRYLVIIDGVRSNWNGSSYNDFDFGVLPAGMLESVEVLPSAAGSVYGNAAKGGVIRITTKKAVEGVKTSINLETGSYGREQENILHLGKSGEWSWSVYARKSIMGDYSSARESIPSYENDETKPPKLVKNIFMTDARKTEDNLTLEYERKFSDTENNIVGIYRRSSNAAYDRSLNVERPWLLDLQTEGFFDRYSKQWHPKHTLTGGVEYYKDKVLNYQDLAAKYSDGTVISKAVYLQDVWQLADSVKAVGSLRQDWNSYAGSKLSPALSLEYQPSEKVLYTLAYTEYFAPPKKLQIFSPDYGDEALKPEEGRVYEAGLTYIPDESSSLKINVFHRDATDVIAVDISLPKYLRRYANIAHEKATGFTVSASKRFSEKWRSLVAYTQTKVDTERKNSSPVSTMIPHGELLLDLMYEYDKYSVLLQGRGVFDQANGRGENRFANNNYWVWNASLNYKLQKNTRLYVKVNNIFNQFYSNWDNESGGFLGFDEWYAEPGRNYQIGINYSF